MTQLSILDLPSKPPELGIVGVHSEGTGRSWAAFGDGGSAVSPYRYALGRHWQEQELSATPRLMVFVMCNPSVANSLDDDPTIRRCRDFATREGCNGLLVCNLFAWRATDQRELLKAEEPVGPLNTDVVRWALRHPHAGLVVVAWGGFKTKRVAERAREPQRLVMALAAGPEPPVALHCLGRTETEPFEPRHPLMLARETALERYT
jgi:hypothetical protein